MAQDLSFIILLSERNLKKGLAASVGLVDNSSLFKVLFGEAGLYSCVSVLLEFKIFFFFFKLSLEFYKNLCIFISLSSFLPPAPDLSVMICRVPTVMENPGI